MTSEQVAVSMWSVHRTFHQNGWTVFDFLDFAGEAGIRKG